MYTAGHPGSVVGHVAHQRRIRPGALGLGAQQVADDVPAALLLALEDEAHVERRPALGVERGLVGLEQAEHLALVVRGAAGVQPAVAHGGLERRAGPLLERVGRLHVVVAVDQQRRPAGHVRALGPHHRMAVAFDELARSGSRGCRARRAATRPRAGSRRRGSGGRSHWGSTGSSESSPSRRLCSRATKLVSMAREKLHRIRTTARGPVTRLTASAPGARLPSRDHDFGMPVGTRGRPLPRSSTRVGGRMSRGQLMPPSRRWRSGAHGAARWPRKIHPQPGGSARYLGVQRGRRGGYQRAPWRVGAIDTTMAPMDSLRTGRDSLGAGGGAGDTSGWEAGNRTRPGRATARARAPEPARGIRPASPSPPSRPSRAPPGPATPRAPARRSRAEPVPRRSEGGMRCGMPPSSSALRASASGPTACCRERRAACPRPTACRRRRRPAARRRCRPRHPASACRARAR